MSLWKSLKEWTRSSRNAPSQDLSRSQYSIVNTDDLTADTLKLWLQLPEEVKNDPSLAPLKQIYEKEKGTESVPLKPKTKKLLPVKSAPLLSSLQVLAEDIEFIDEKKNEAIQEFLEKNDGLEKDVQYVRNTPSTSPSPTNVEEKKPTRIDKAKYYTKMTILIGCWIFFTTVFLLYNEKKDVLMRTAIVPGEDKRYILPYRGPDLSLELTLSGPFISPQQEMKYNKSELDELDKIQVWMVMLEGSDSMATDIERDKSPPWMLYLQESTDFNDGERRSHTFKLNSNRNSNFTSNSTTYSVFPTDQIKNLDLPSNSTLRFSKNTSPTNSNFTRNLTLTSNFTTDTNTYSTSARFAMKMNTSSSVPVSLSLSYSSDPLDPNTGVICSLVLLSALYVLIIFEIINRTMSAILISTLSLSVLAIVGQRPSLPEVVSWLDIETLLLLFSMMLLVAIMAETGIFDFLAVFTFEVTKGKLWPLIFLLCGITAVLSTFLDNVTTVLLMSPVTIRLCEVMELDPVPILMFMAIFSNIGGTATPVGDPPCVIVASNKNVIQGGINFTNFTAHMSLGILLVFIQTTLQFRFMYRDTNKLRLNVPRDIQDLRQQISIWRRAAESLPHLSKDVLAVRERLEQKIRKLTSQLHRLEKENSKRACPKETYQSTLVELKAKFKIRDKVLLAKASVAICFVVVLFFLHSIPELNRVSLGWTALLGAILLLILADREDIEPILHRVEWSTLLFFAALFVLMEALAKLGLILYIGGLMEQLIVKVDEGARLAAAIVIIIWVSGAISAFVDNIPLSTMMVRVVVNIAANPKLNLPLGPLIWALLFGACLGGNGTLIGASANVVCAGVAEQHGYKFTFSKFFKAGFPIMIGHLIVATGYLLVCHCVFTWH